MVRAARMATSRKAREGANPRLSLCQETMVELYNPLEKVDTRLTLTRSRAEKLDMTTPVADIEPDVYGTSVGSTREIPQG